MDIAAEVRRVIAKVLKRPVQDLSNETKLQDLGAESIDFKEIVFEIEETFQIDLTVTIGNPQTAGKEQDNALSDFATVGDICRAVETVVAAKAPK